MAFWCCIGFLLVAAGRGCSLVAVHRLLVAVACLVAEPGLSVVAAPGLGSTGSVIVAHGLSCSAARGIFLNQGSNLCLLH